MALCVFLLMGPQVAAQEKGKDEADSKAEIRGYIPVQLLSLSIPIMTREGWIGRGAATIFLVVRGQGNVERLCKFLPRVREAITITVDQSPVPVIGEKYVFQEIGAKLHKAINKVLPAPLVIRLHMFPMSRLMGKNADILELPGTSGECLALKEMPQDLQDKLKGKNTEAKSFSVADPEAPPKPKKVKPRKSVEAPRGLLAQSAIIVNKMNRPAPAKESPSEKSCRPLKKVWPEGFHQALGARFWLNKAFSLDEDNDGAVDNVGFILKSEDRPELFVYYFPGPGRQSVISVPTLRLKDDRDVPKTCFGQVSYEKPETKKKPQPVFKVPDLAGEMVTKPEKTKKDETPLTASNGAPDLSSGIGLVFLLAIGAGVLLILGGGLGYVFARKKTDRRRKERRREKKQRRMEEQKKDGSPEEPDRRKEDERRVDERREKEDRRE